LPFPPKEKELREQPNPDRNTLLVYWYLWSSVTNRSGPRSVQRAIGFSSPSSALFHLTKLEEMGLIQKQRNGHYEIVLKKKFGLMKRFVFIFHQWVPKNVIYLLILAFAVFAILLLLFPMISWYVVIALLPAIVSIFLQIYEIVLLWKNRPRFKSS
jgi:magnesium-transporting ATPase (P-type)